MLTVFVSNKSEQIALVKEAYKQVARELRVRFRFVNNWDLANVIWKPTPNGIEPERLPQLRYFSNLFTTASTLTEKTSLLQTGLKVFGPEGFFGLAPYTVEYDPQAPAVQQVQLPETAVSGFGKSIWITKPGAGFSGIGIQLFRDTQTMMHKLNRPETGRTVIQKYLENPLLINGHKFDIRMYIMMVGNRILYYRDGFVRINPTDYTLNNLDLKTHLTNLDLHGIEGNTMPLDRLADVGIPPQKLYDFLIKLKPLFQYAQQVEKDYKAEHKITVENFELFGLDIIIDTNGRPWLLEVNKSPGFIPQLTSIISDTLKEGVFSKVISAQVPTKFTDL